MVYSYGLFMRPIAPQSPVSHNRDGAGGYRMFMFWGVLIGLIVNIILTLLIIFADGGQVSKISKNSQNHDYYRNYYPGVLGQLRLARTRSSSPYGLSGQDTN